MTEARFIHPGDIKVGLLATLLHEIQNDDMTVRDLVTKLNKFDYQVSAVSAIASINRE